MNSLIKFVSLDLHVTVSNAFLSYVLMLKQFNWNKLWIELQFGLLLFGSCASKLTNCDWSWIENMQSRIEKTQYCFFYP